MTTTELENEPMFWARLQFIIERSVAGLDEQDRAERIAWCRRTGRHGVTVLHEGDGLRLEWGGSTLAVIDPQVFEDDAFFEVLDVTFLPIPPEDASELEEN